MVGFQGSNSAKQISETWQGFRRKAEHTALSIEEFSPQEIVRYDLKNLKYGIYVDSTYVVNDRPIEGEVEGESYDIRELDNR